VTAIISSDILPTLVSLRDWNTNSPPRWQTARSARDWNGCVKFWQSRLSANLFEDWIFGAPKYRSAIYTTQLNFYKSDWSFNLKRKMANPLDLKNIW